MLRPNFLASVAVSTALLIVRAAGDVVVLETRSNIPAGFSLTSPADSNLILNLQISLRQGNITGLETELYEISNPDSERYGQFLSQEAVSSFVAPSSITTSSVTQWLSVNNVTASTTSYAGDWLGISLPVGTANALLGANFSIFAHGRNGQRTIRTLSYSIPSSLQNHINLVHPTVK